MNSTTRRVIILTSKSDLKKSLTYSHQRVNVLNFLNKNNRQFKFQKNKKWVKIWVQL